jgi:hypothetical protein
MKSRTLIILFIIAFTATANGQTKAPAIDTILLMSKNLTSVPDSIFKHTQLKVLNLGAGWIIYPPLGVRPSAGEHNSIRKFPRKIGLLTELRSLILHLIV